MTDTRENTTGNTEPTSEGVLEKLEAVQAMLEDIGSDCEWLRDEGEKQDHPSWAIGHLHGHVDAARVVIGTVGSLLDFSLNATDEVAREVLGEW